MTVIAFRAGPRRVTGGADSGPVPLVGTFRSPRGRVGHMRGSLRVRRLVIVPRGTFVAGVCTGTLHDADGSLIGVDTRRATIEADLLRQDDGYATVLRPFEVDLMGLTVSVATTTIDPTVLHTPGSRRPGAVPSTRARLRPP